MPFRLRLSGTQSGPGVLLLVLCAGSLAACASSSASLPPGRADIPFHGVRSPTGIEQLTWHTSAPATLRGRSTAAVAVEAIHATEWPLASMDTAENRLVTRWARIGGDGPLMRLVVRPSRQDARMVVLGEQVWQPSGVRYDAAMEYARSVLTTFSADILSQQPGPPGSRLRYMLDCTNHPRGCMQVHWVQISTR